jgi:hypothetical protein
MVIHARALLFAAAALLAALAGSTCKVVNEDHCANQDVPGNEWCRELNFATPYCSPCRREYHGCVDYEPYACEGYDNEIGEDPVDDGPEESSSEGEPGSTGEAEAPTSTDEAGSGSTGSSASSTGTGS